MKIKKRAWVQSVIEVDLEWEVEINAEGEVEANGEIPALKSKLEEAGIGEFHRTQYDPKTAEYECQECGEWKDATEFYKRMKDGLCVDCTDRAENPTEQDKRDAAEDRAFDEMGEGR